MEAEQTQPIPPQISADGLLWTNKYAPIIVEQIAGNETAKSEVVKWALEFTRGNPQKPLLLHGPCGVGKTATAHALAKEMGWAMIEANAGDIRDAETVKKLFGLTSASSGLFGEQRLILIDEVDAAFDRGEVPELLKLLREATQPVLLTANDIWEQKLGAVRALARPVEFKKINARSIAEVLRAITVTEKLAASEEAIAAISKNSQGDIRCAINDLQANGGVLDQVNSNRDREANVFESVRTVFKSKDYASAVAASNNLDIDLDMFVKWIEENIPAEYEKPSEIAEAYEKLSRSSEFTGRIRRRQNYSLLKYVRALSHAGVALAKEAPYFKFTPYQFPQIIKKLSSSKTTREGLKTIGAKIGTKTHASTKRALNSTAAYIANAPGAMEYFGFDEDEEKLILSAFKAPKLTTVKKSTASKAAKVQKPETADKESKVEKPTKAKPAKLVVEKETGPKQSTLF